MNSVRRGFGLKQEVRPLILTDYHSQLIERARLQGGILTVGRLTFRLAEEFGFCYGVDFALNLVYETRSMYPNRRIFLLSEILHSPDVNRRLREMGIELLSTIKGDVNRFAHVNSDDIVVVPAFGAMVDEYRALQEKGCLIVDTTCSSVMAVWKRVEGYARDGFTAVIHGRHDHEETRATKSRTSLYPTGRYLIVHDKEAAADICRYIVEGGDREEFRARFEQFSSPDFNPELDLRRIGLANQTTMLSDESLAIADMFSQAIVHRYGSAALAEQFRHFDTICTATQKRQDAATKLARGDVDLMLVIGGYNSSNTTHLSEISRLYKPTYHISGAACIISPTCIRSLPAGGHEEAETRNWLPEGKLTLGLTAGASTPARVIGEVIDRIVGCVPTVL
jgi:4-hydroxy-3-methylbut-2-enyl diphosphate reductase